MNEAVMKLYRVECGYLNEVYHIFADDREQVDKILFGHFLEMELHEPEDVDYEIVGEYDIEPGLITSRLFL